MEEEPFRLLSMTSLGSGTSGGASGALSVDAAAQKALQRACAFARRSRAGSARTGLDERMHDKALLAYRGALRTGSAVTSRATCVPQKYDRSLRSLLCEPIFAMKAAEYSSLHNLVSDRQSVSVLVGRNLVRHGSARPGPNAACGLPRL